MMGEEHDSLFFSSPAPRGRCPEGAEGSRYTGDAIMLVTAMPMGSSYPFAKDVLAAIALLRKPMALPRRDWLPMFLTLKHGVPSHDTFTNVFRHQCLPAARSEGCDRLFSAVKTLLDTARRPPRASRRAASTAGRPLFSRSALVFARSWNPPRQSIRVRREVTRVPR